ncbi:TatD family hydrolase [Brevibacillus laterosporus]|uniref:TatD family hydrolase n=1 Tax=Brevibacillus laterosporus TaxID=1465 RepID=A0AAP3DCS1_BRELA|nr:TatD family hydrolase [Brevibacillus laterosporus]MCR8978355.1 TatD family hydrolase [Brevibacillus laterosporus]MCZ0805511.1 TatD family hydrolase [Brevibacillus laterosporus]MCZ0825833.1 TatD family hydrolase [Brevibacillus laterosporus]MCZ0850117.1 TatD family hydrolase [Brevibacillus laterosporus]
MPNGSFPMIDAHIHLDLYNPAHAQQIMEECQSCGIKKVIAVSMNLSSCLVNREWLQSYPEQVKVAYGFHPEQKLPAEEEIQQLFDWIDQHQAEMVAIGEVGLPYYTHLEAKKNGQAFDPEPYIHLLERFVKTAGRYEKPIILHAVYEDAEIACDLLEKHNVTKAHFHWFKGSESTTLRMSRSGYYISVTPDVVYEPEIQQLILQYPLEQIMIETDGPWPFEGPFTGQVTHPVMMKDSCRAIANVKGLSIEETASILYQNTKHFYGM